MRTLFAFVDYGQGWENISSHLRDQAALSGVSVEWGASAVASTPEIPVARLTVHDRTGWLAGRAATLAGTLIALQITRSPLWSDLQRTLMPADSTWSDRTETWATLHDPVKPDPASPPDWQDATTIFVGTLSVGTTVTPTHNGSQWDVELYAQSLSVQLQRMRCETMGGQSSVIGTVWSGSIPTLWERIKTVIGQMPQPVLPLDGITLPDAGGATIIGWDSDEENPQVTVMDVLTALTSWNPTIPQWYETYVSGEVWPRLKPVYTAAAATVTITDTATTVTDGSITVDPIPVGMIVDSTSSLKSPTPKSGLTINAMEAEERTEEFVLEKDNPETPENEERTETRVVGADTKDTELVVETPDMPGIIRTLGETISVSSRIATVANPSLGINAWAITTAQTTTAENFLRTINSRLTPEIEVTTRKLTLDDNEHAYKPEPTLWWLHDTKFKLEDDTGANPLDGVYMSIGGTLEFSRQGDQTTLRHTPTIIPVSTSIEDRRTNGQ